MMRTMMTNQSNKEFYTQLMSLDDCEEFPKKWIIKADDYKKQLMTDEELNKWAENWLKDDIYKDWSEEKKAIFKKIMIESKKAEPDICDETLAFRTMIDIETIEKCKEIILKQNGEGTKFERTNVEHEENEFERIRGEYNVQEN